MTAVEIAKQLKFVREKTNQNDGPWVEAILRTVGLPKGSPWCMGLVAFCLTIASGGTTTFPQTGSCDVVLEWARKNKRIETSPLPGDVFLVMKNENDAIHTGFVTSVHAAAFKTVEGNTNDDGSREGFGVFERERKLDGKCLFVRMPA